MAEPAGLKTRLPKTNGERDPTAHSPAHANDEASQSTPEHDRFDREGPRGDDRPNATDSLPHYPSRRVITGLPRTQTFTRKLSEQRQHLEPIATRANERRPASADERFARMSNPISATDTDAPSGILSDNFHSLYNEHGSNSNSSHTFRSEHGDYRLSSAFLKTATTGIASQFNVRPQIDDFSTMDIDSLTTSQYDALLAYELETKWILNLSMHYRDGSRREKFFVTYRRKKDQPWRRVTISLDYRDPPLDSLEMELSRMRNLREKSAKVYDAIRESLSDIAFYDTVTNLKLQTTDGRLHVHVVEDGNEIINYPLVREMRDSLCRLIRERDVHFDGHLSGFVYKVRVRGQTLVKKEIPSPDSINAFLYEINALSSLHYSKHVIRLYGLVVDNQEEHITGLLLSYAARGSLSDVIFENCKERNFGIPWIQRERWAKQIVHGLADIHESGYVQGDFTLSNIVVNAAGDAKIIDINRRGCPMGWEPPESRTIVVAHNHFNMYIGVKSDLYQLGMVLWALAMLEDEPDLHPRPLLLDSGVRIPDWYRNITEVCLSADPRRRLSASSLLRMFPPHIVRYRAASMSLSPFHDDDDDDTWGDRDGAYAARLRQDSMYRTPTPSAGYGGYSRTYSDSSPDMYEPYYPMRGRSPPSPLPGHREGCEPDTQPYSSTSWAANKSVRPSYSDVPDDDSVMAPNDRAVGGTASRPETPLSLRNLDADSVAYISADVSLRDVDAGQAGGEAGARVPLRFLGDGLKVLSPPRLPRYPAEAPGPGRDVGSDSRTASPRNEGAAGRPLSAARGGQIKEGDVDGGVSLQPGDVSSTEVDEPTDHVDLKSDRQASSKGQTNGRCRLTRRRGKLASRQRSLPISLAGIGASLLVDADETAEDEFSLARLGRPATVQALMDTTEIPEMRKIDKHNRIASA
ncbi:hypothetical protein E4U13_006655 [Claviceps humidiphila]|uniref:Protein kinase domain-containing protein n=1 Tax=Claviceps humidiphila TaxID=1294629 RepID=A0A9P7QAP0_9HYPO|nr:hypothetical protein E4U13_006655 [Claviceps humidiphila]